MWNKEGIEIKFGWYKRNNINSMDLDISDMRNDLNNTHHNISLHHNN